MDLGKVVTLHSLGSMGFFNIGRNVYYLSQLKPDNTVEEI